MQTNKLTKLILLSLLLGILCGYWVNINPGAIEPYTSNVVLLTDIFLRLIKMIIAPLVFTTLVTGIAKMGNVSTIGRVGGKTLGWFFFMALVSLTLGVVMVHLFQPGVDLNLPLPPVTATSGIQASAMSLKDFVQHTFPTSVFAAMSSNAILQIVVFSLFFGVATASLGERAQPLIRDLDLIAHIMLKLTGYIMNLAPIAVFAAVSVVIAKQGLGVLVTYGKFIASFYLAIAILWALIIGFGFLALGKRVFTLVRGVRVPMLLAFSTASSEAAYPKTLEQLERFGCSNRIASFVLPVGYSFNLDGSMLYCTFAALFIAQAYGIELSVAQQATMVLILMLTSKGMAGVPRASLVVIAATLSQFNIPEAGLLLILGIDHFLDMARSATNVLGNAVATAMVSKWEKELKPAHHEHEHAHAPVSSGHPQLASANAEQHSGH